MTGTTHLFAGAAAGVALANHAAADDIKTAGLIVLSSAVFSLAPDIDVRGSKMSNSVGNLPSGVLRLFTEHRGFFHSPFCYLVLGAVAYAFFPGYFLIEISAVLGALTHIFLDSFNAYGCPLLYPWPRRFHFARIKSRGFTDKVLTVVFFLFFIWLAGERFELWEKVLKIIGVRI